jgi:hypothetical protein
LGAVHYPPGEKVKVESDIIGPSGPLTHSTEEIDDFAERKNIVLMVIATRGRTGIKRQALGSTADRVMWDVLFLF